MGFLNFVHKPNRNDKDTNKAINQVKKDRIIKVQREENLETTVYEIQKVNSIKHSDGSTTDLIQAIMETANADSTIYRYMQKPICFEVPRGEENLIESIIKQINYKVTLPNDKYTYLGRAYADNDVRVQPPTQFVNGLIQQLNEGLAKKIEADKEIQRHNIEEAQRYQQMKQQKQAEMAQRSQQEDVLERIRRRNTPYLKGGIMPNGEEEYNGINTINGEILKIREIHKVGKDEKSTYLYTAWINSTQNEDDVEIPKAGIPVAFTLHGRLNDIVNENYDKETKARLINGILNVFSDGYLKNINESNQWNTSKLHDIGGIDEKGQTFLHNNKENVSEAISKTIEELAEEYEEQKDEER